MNYRRLVLIFVLLTALLAGLVAQDRETFDLDVSGIAEANNFGLFGGGAIGFEMESDVFNAYGDLRFVNDGKWNATESWIPDGFYFDLREGYVELNSSPLHFQGGFIPATHEFSENPFELILDAKGKPALGMSFLYDGTLFAYQTRWIGLNYRSPFAYDYNSQFTTWLDRGLNHKIYMLKFGKLRLAYQESSIFLDRFFDANFFLNPAPSIFVNTLWSQGDNPWVYDVNDSSFMGFYGDYTTSEFRVEGEIMIKDINTPFGYPDNLNKFGWSLGGTWDSPWGELSFWHGGATEHLYAATYSSGGYSNTLPYEYTYYPVNVLGNLTIDLQDSYIGFPFGENSLAFQLGWADDIVLFDLPVNASAKLNYVLSGSKSPHNPWHEYDSWTQIPAKTQLFAGDSALENRLNLVLHGRTGFGPVYIDATLGLGLIVNPLELEVPIPGESGIWKPAAGVVRNDSLIEISLGYRLHVE